MAVDSWRRTADLMASVHIMCEYSKRLAGDDGPGRPSQRPGGPDERPARGTHDLYAQAEAARKQSQALAGQLHATQRTTRENWQLIGDAWNRAEHIRVKWLADHTDPDRLRYSAFARLQARMASMPVIEQAKGIIMARYGWPEEEAFDAIRRASQRENVKVRELAASVVARTVRSAAARRHAGSL